MAQTVVRSGKGFRTIITARTHTVYADEPVADGGTDTAPTPMELMLGALGACMAITVQMYAKRKAWPLEGIEIALDIERFKGGEYPLYQGEAQFVHELRDQVILHGSQLSEEQRIRLFEIAGKCPVHRVIENPAFFVDELLKAEAASGD